MVRTTVKSMQGYALLTYLKTVTFKLCCTLDQQAAN